MISLEPVPTSSNPGPSFPAIWQQVVIDGNTEPGSTLATVTNPANLQIVLDGSLLPPGEHGLVFEGAALGSAVRGLVFQNFSEAAIFLDAISSPVTIQGNHIGVDVTGTLAVGGTYGIYSNSDNHLIGGPDPEHRNVISGNTYGIWLLFGHDNSVINNYVGTDSTGTSSVSNDLGIYAGSYNNIGSVDGGNVISGNIETGLNVNNTFNLVGGRHPGQGNVIAGGNNGIVVYNGDSRIIGNFVGTDITGTITDTDGNRYSPDFGFLNNALLLKGLCAADR